MAKVVETNKSNNLQLSIRLNRDVKKQIDKYAKDNKISVSEAFRISVNKLIAP
jgi:antitoxin component of RelBE/YafQ-DinJ toxin-antitoxin module